MKRLVVIPAVAAVALLGAMSGSALAKDPFLVLNPAGLGDLHAGEEFTPTAGVYSASNGNDATVKIQIFPAGNATCSGNPEQIAIFNPGRGNDTYGDHAFIALGVGDFWGKATIAADGDVGDTAQESECAKVATATPATPDLRVQPSVPTATVGGLIHVNGFLLGGYDLTADEPRLQMKIFGPGDPSCTGQPVASNDIPAFQGQFTGIEYAPTVPGTYHLYARYPGNVNNLSVASECNEKTAITVAPGAPESSGGGGGEAAHRRTGKRAAALRKCKKAKKAKKAKKKKRKACVKKAKKLPV